MASFDGAYESLIQGVSQQVPTSRLPGQVTEQVNMVSDLVTGLRRRTGSKFRRTLSSAGVDPKSVKAWRTEVGGVSAECFLNASTGELIMLEQDGSKYGEEAVHRFQADYLKASDIDNIRSTGVGDSMFILNTERVPKASSPSPTVNYKTSGFVDVIGSALNTKFTVRIKAEGLKEYVGSFTTPDGTQPEHAGYVSGEFIAKMLKSSLEGTTWEAGKVPEPEEGKDPDPNAKPEYPTIVEEDTDFKEHFKVVQDGSLLFIVSTEDLNVEVRTDNARVYIQTSGRGVLGSVSALPSRLPVEADGVVYDVGATGSSPTYYKYSFSKSVWEEVGLPGSPTGIDNMPVEIYWDGGEWVLNDKPFEGRLAGDDDSNPDPDFVDWGITGIASYQGRLVLMSGSWVLLSATNKPRVFYRTTVEELLDTDPIEIGSSSAGSASFKYGLVFNRDLLLFSPEHQALIPGMAQAITPKSAHILVTSTYTADMTCEPITLGSSIMYPMPRSTTHFGIQEMLPSAYTDSMYMSADATEHIPTYLEGRCRFAVASTVGNMALFASSTDRRVLYVHEYLWSGDEKVLKSWHRWEYPYDIAHAYFAGGLINLVLVDSDTSNIILVDLDPKAGDGTVVETRNYYLDMHRTATVVHAPRPYINVPKDFWAFCKAYNLDEYVRVAYHGKDLNSMEVGADPVVVESGTPRIYLNPSTTASKVVIGFSYVSRFIPGAPVFKDFKERVITFNRVQLMKMYTLTNRTGIYEVSIIDKDRSFDKSYEVNPVRWLSTELNLGKLPVAGTIGNVIPCRIDAYSGEVEFRSVGLTEMNIINIEYTCKAGVMRQRR